MKLFFTITKKGLGIALCFITVIFVSVMWFSSLRVSAVDGSTHQKRMLYIKSLNLQVNEESCSSKETVIPKEFSNVYENYNKLQKNAGFDLSNFKGKAVTVYSYPLKDQNKVLTLLVFNGDIIGGDIAETKLNGKMMPLKR